MIKVSVIVPVYNTEKFLRKCLDSLVNQTLHELEIIVINDGSTDGSSEIINEYKKFFPKKIQSIFKENGGQATARNLGIEIAKGEYIGFVDSDDFVANNMFEEMYNVAIKNSADLVQCDYAYLLYENNCKKKLKNYAKIREIKEVKDMFLDPLVSPWNKLYKASVLKNSGVKFPEGLIYEDTEFYINLIPYIKKVSSIDKEYVSHILRKGSTVNTSQDPRVENMLNIIENIIDFYKSRGFWNKYYNELEYFCTKILLCSSLKRIALIEDKNLKNKMVINTLTLIEKNFPKYKKNIYFKLNFKGIYIKCINNQTIKFYLLILKLLRKKE